MRSEALLLIFSGLSVFLALCSREEMACVMLLVGIIVWLVKLLEELT